MGWIERIKVPVAHPGQEREYTRTKRPSKNQLRTPCRDERTWAPRVRCRPPVLLPLLALPQRALDVALLVLCSDVGALVVKLLTVYEPELDLDQVVRREVHAQRDERVALLLRLADQLANLLLV